MTGVTTHVNFDLPTHAQDMQWPIEKNFVVNLQRNRQSQKFLKGIFW